MKNDQDIPDYSELESLFINNPQLNKIQAYLNRFNPIQVMKMEKQEIRHSNILGWLLDPLGTHGLGDRFLRSFLAKALEGEYRKGGLTSLEILQTDLRDTNVKREWNNIDILLFSAQNNFTVVIENKFNARQSKGQLTNYINKIKNLYQDDYPNLRVKGVFLTLHDEEPEDDSYATIGYDSVCEILSTILEIEETSLSHQVKIFIQHYIEILAEATGMSEHAKEMEKIAKSLYRQHYKVLDFIWSHGSTNEFNLALDELFGAEWEDKKTLKFKNLKISDFWINGNIFAFLPTSWIKEFDTCNTSWNGCENWWNGYPLICWIELKTNENTTGTLRLFSEIGPLDNYEDRLSIINHIKNIANQQNLQQISFQKAATDVRRKYSKFLKGNSVEVKDVQDIDEISTKVSKLFSDFESCLDKVTIALQRFKEDRYSS